MENRNRKVDLWLISIFLIAFFIRVPFALTGRATLSGDELFYDPVGVSLASGSGYLYEGVPTASKCPGYPLFLASIYLLFGHNFVAVRIAQSLLDAVMCGVIYLIAGMLFNRRVGIVAGLLCAIHYFFLKSIQILRPDSLLICLIALLVFYYIKWKRSLSGTDIALMGLFSSAAVMVKPVVALIPFIFILMELPIVLKNNIKLTKFLKNIALFALIFFLPIIIWAVRNYNTFHSLIIFSTDGGAALYCSYKIPEGNKFGIIPVDEVTLEADRIGSEAKRSKFLATKAREYILTHKKEVAKLLPLKVLFFWSIFDWETLGDGRGVYNFSTAFILPFVILGIFVARPVLWKCTPIILPIVYFAGFVAIVFQGLPRFRIFIEPYLIIFCACAIISLWDKYSKKIVILSISGWFLFNYVLFANSLFFKQMTKSILQAFRVW
jgi:4-amino-4-deoxy-L-arabinose transferase-like glycosyltransferase